MDTTNKKTAYEALLLDQQILITQILENQGIIERLAAQIGENAPSITSLLSLDQTALNFDDPVGKYFKPIKKVEIRPTEFFNLSLTAAAMSYLDRAQDNAAPYPEILFALRQGGFKMKTGEAEEQRLRLNLLKSTNFTLIPPNTFGLAFVYEKGKRRGTGEKRGRKPNAEKVNDTSAKRGRPPKEKNEKSE